MTDKRPRCYCGTHFNQDEGGIIPEHPYAGPACPECFYSWVDNEKNKETDSDMEKENIRLKAEIAELKSTIAEFIYEEGNGEPWPPEISTK